MTSFAEKLNRLFEKKRKPDGGRYVDEEVQVYTNGAITASHVWRLRNGLTANPTFLKIKALCDFFQVDANYFFQDDAAEPVPPQPELAQLAFRARDLSDQDLESMVNALELVRQVREAQSKQ